MEYKVEPLPSLDFRYFDRDNLCYVRGIKTSSEYFSPCNHANRVEYIRISDMQGTWYQAGIRDGDLLVSNLSATNVKVARPNPEKNTYDILEFAIPKGEEGIEHYPIYFNLKEMERYNNAIEK